MNDDEIRKFAEKIIRPGCADAYTIGMRAAFLEGARFMRNEMEVKWGIIE